MALRLYLNGDFDGQGQFFSLFLIVMRGEYDAILPWPFTSKVTFSLIDQPMSNSALQGMTRSFQPDLQSSSFQRPRAFMNEAYGFKQFISLEDFSQDVQRYLKDDTLLIHVCIDGEGFNSGTAFSGTEYYLFKSIWFV